ncbi:hypothetical protein [Sedimentibacter sp. B4]|uniref:hypothetical protein n=1 Tax=Sedimentibacter sp. B4 TaxID=304766 RepID=UPI0002DD281F|nr:hypothetical protein [Sedimentibacter sp. B4]
MKTFVCIDDTDNLETRGTGELASIMIEKIEEKGWGRCTYITRHQLYFHPDIPYTSHNSAMCFVIDHTNEIFEDLKNFAVNFLETETAEGSDPGLCIAEYDKIKDKEILMNYGRKAKKEILNKQIAYKTAHELGIHLSEHGGTGGGIIGALAGVGLRLTGNDGRIKGKMKFPIPGNTLTVKQILENSDIDKVQSIDGQVLGESENINLGEKVKAVFLDYSKVLLVYSAKEEQTGAASWNTCIKEQLKKY